ncbi:MAG: hypothetical protein EXR59_02790 [Dehalococcoidia bacterium]|nr:hypothetical protein [Dehalococcoidia bacterium]
MGKVVLAIGTSHHPGILGGFDRQSMRYLEKMYGSWTHLKNAVRSVQPDLILNISNEHHVNFYEQNMPAICVGTGASHFGPTDGDNIRVAKGQIKGHPNFAADLVRSAYSANFDLSWSKDLSLDHGHMVPYQLFNPEHDIPMVPILINTVLHPMPEPARIYQFGAFLGHFIASRPKNERIVIIGAGGVAHDVGTPRSGWVDVDFDHQFLENLEHVRIDRMKAYTSEQLSKSGNGTHEIKSWLAAMGAMGEIKPKVLAYEGEEVGVGTAVAVWEP